MIQVNGLKKAFDGFVALNGVDMHVEKGAIYGLVGPNGAGKSTLIRHLTGVYRPDQGEVQIDGENVYENKAVKSKIAYIPDELFYFMQADTMEMKRFYEGIYPSFDGKLFYRMQEFFPNIDVKRNIRRLSKGMHELGRLEAAEHLAYCDKCTDRYTALLTADALTDPPRDVRRTVMSTIWVRLMQSTYGRAAVAGVAAVLALTMWRTGALTFVTDHGSDLQALLPTVQVTLPEKQPPKLLPEKLGKPVTSRPGENIYTRVSSVLESLLNAAENIKS